MRGGWDGEIEVIGCWGLWGGWSGVGRVWVGVVGDGVGFGRIQVRELGSEEFESWKSEGLGSGRLELAKLIGVGGELGSN